jgi:periplasmic copper chaperone A
LVLGFVLALATAAGAHTELDPDEGGPGLQLEVRLHVENERSGAGTVKVELALPASPAIPIVAIPEVAGWTASQLAAAEGTGPRVVWEGGPERDAADLPIVLGPLPATEQRLQFKVLQTYEDGEIVRWIDDWPAGAPEPANPGPVLDVVADGPGTVPEAVPTTVTTASATTAPGVTTGLAATTTATTTAAPAATTAATAPGTTAATATAATAATPTTAPTGDDDDGNTLAFVAVGVLLLAVVGLVVRSARRPSR